MFKVKIKNIGKLTDREINVGQFTVFAGPNNTGKSFISKLLYSFFNSMQDNPIQTRTTQFFADVFSDVTLSIAIVNSWEQGWSDSGSSLELSERSIQRMRHAESVWRKGKSTDSNNHLLIALDSKIREMDKIVKSINNIERLTQIWPYLGSLTEEMWNVSQNLEQAYLTKLKIEKLDLLDTIIDPLTELKDTFAKGDPLSFIISGTGRLVEDNLIYNFQVPNLSDLSADSNQWSEIEVGRFGKFVFSNGEVDFSMDMVSMPSYSRAIYLESPTYWKLKSVLEHIRQPEGYRSFLWGKARKRLDGVPKYFHDLASALSFQYTGEMAFPAIHEKLTGPHVLGGKITISEMGNLSFQENGRSFSLPVTAMGIANLGILALLIERKVLDEESLIFIDEPEAHLHPAWQVIMAEALFELSLQGVTVVIATHSVDILKWLEVHVKKNPQDEPLIALNQFPANGDGVDEDFESRMASIKQELTKPFSDLYLKGI